MADGLTDFHSDGFAPIHRACWGRKKRHADTIQAFLDENVDPELLSKDGRAPLDMCATKWCRDVLERAIAAKTDNHGGEL